MLADKLYSIINFFFISYFSGCINDVRDIRSIHFL